MIKIRNDVKYVVNHFETLISEDASNASSRSDYYKVASGLKDLLKIEGGREVVVRLLKNFQAQYVRRPAMMDELNRVL